MKTSTRLASATAISLLTLGSLCFASCSGGDANTQPGTVPVPASTPQAIPSVAPSSMPSGMPSPIASATPFEFMTGAYGGANAELTYHSNGSASLKFACANGQIHSPIPVDSFGNFNATGTYQSTNGPTPVGGYPVYTTSYYGIVVGNDLQLYGNYQDGAGNVVAIGPFALTFGQPGMFDLNCAD